MQGQLPRKTEKNSGNSDCMPFRRSCGVGQQLVYASTYNVEASKKLVCGCNSNPPKMVIRRSRGRDGAPTAALSLPGNREQAAVDECSTHGVSSQRRLVVSAGPGSAASACLIPVCGAGERHSLAGRKRSSPAPDDLGSRPMHAPGARRLIRLAPGGLGLRKLRILDRPKRLGYQTGT
jgi:hypothetical protein